MVNLTSLWISRIPDDIQQDLDVTWGIISPDPKAIQVSSNFTPDELDLARKMQESGKTEQDFMKALPDYRSFRDTQEVETTEEDLSGLDIWVKLGAGISDVAQKFKFQSNIDDGIIESWLKFLWNLPANTAQIWWDIISILSDPVGTVKSVNTLWKAAIETWLNKLFLDEWEEFFTSEEVEQVADSVGAEFKKLGDPGRIKELLVENPADVLLTFVWGLWVAKNVAKSKNLTSLSSKIAKAETALNPIKLQADALRTVKTWAGKVKQSIFPTKSFDDIVLEVTQGKVTDIPAFTKTISEIDTSKIKTYNELSGSFWEKITDLVKLQDSNLSKIDNIAPDSLITTSKWGTIKKNFVKQAMDDLEELYETIDDLDGQERIVNLKAKTQISEIDINDLAREYNVEFGKKAFSQRTWDPLTSVNAEKFETTRKWVKNSLRERLPDDTAKAIDTELSNLYSSKLLTDKMAANVINLSKKIEQRGLIENISRWLWKTIDILSLRSARGFLTSFLPSNVGNKILNAVTIEGNLAKNLKRLEQLNKKESKLKDAEFEIEAKSILEDIVWKWALPIESASQEQNLENN